MYCNIAILTQAISIETVCVLSDSNDSQADVFLENLLLLSLLSDLPV